MTRPLQDNAPKGYKMKKLFLIFCGLALLSACGPTPAELQAKAESAAKERKEIQNKKDIEFINAVNNKLLERDLFTTLQVYDSLFSVGLGNTDCCSKGLINTNCYHFEREGLKQIVPEGKYQEYMNMDEAIKEFTTLGDRAKCLTADYTEYNNYGIYSDNSDECILVRREIVNNSKASKVCYFNYKKYLPTESKVSSDDNFDKLAYYYKTLIKSGHCDNLAEATTNEKEKCKEKDINKIVQFMKAGKLEHCRDKMPKEYNAMLKDGVKKVNDANAVVGGAWIGNNPLENVYANSMYAGSFEAQFKAHIKEFGNDNMCDTTGFEQDIKKLSSQKTADKKSN
jgi:hypothetical protein